jgi:hypothetical protein
LPQPVRPVPHQRSKDQSSSFRKRFNAQLQQVNRRREYIAIPTTLSDFTKFSEQPEPLEAPSTTGYRESGRADDVRRQPRAAFELLDKAPSISNYFIGNDRSKWRSNVPNYRRVRAREVYQGVDVLYYGEGSQLEYDFVEKPGADPARTLMVTLVLPDERPRYRTTYRSILRLFLFRARSIGPLRRINSFN